MSGMMLRLESDMKFVRKLLSRSLGCYPQSHGQMDSYFTAKAMHTEA